MVSVRRNNGQEDTALADTKEEQPPIHCCFTKTVPPPIQHTRRVGVVLVVSSHHLKLLNVLQGGNLARLCSRGSCAVGRGHLRRPRVGQQRHAGGGSRRRLPEVEAVVLAQWGMDGVLLCGPRQLKQ